MLDEQLIFDYNIGSIYTYRAYSTYLTGSTRRPSHRCRPFTWGPGTPLHRGRYTLQTQERAHLCRGMRPVFAGIH